MIAGDGYAGRTVLEELAAVSQELARVRAREEDFIATVSHELRTPVAVMRGYLEALADEDALAPYRGMIDPIRRSGDRLIQMVDHLLAGTHPETLVTVRPGRVDLSCVARAAVSFVLAEARRMDVRIRLETATDPAPVSGDFGRLCQVVEHLVRNAVLFSGPGGEVVLRAVADQNGPGLEVVDHGVGVPADELPYLTERFYRGRHARVHAVPGVGLGLSIAEGIVAAHGGTLTISSAGPGLGVTAQVRMPALRQSAEHCTTTRRTVRRVRPAHRTRP
ncbi:MAG: HAMP domain-containing sensor histidine kinase [Actinoplanes sp.]